jgi:tetratricopeptide (TPR) repeat protein
MRSTVVLVFLGLLPGCVWGQESASGVGEKVTDGAAKYAAESIVGERQDTVYRYAADGTGSKEMTAVLRIQSEAAARQFGVLTIPFAGSNERVEIDYVRVRKPDGSVVETPAADAQEMPQEVTRQAPFYSDLKEKQLPVRNLRVGDKLEYKARVVRTKAEAPGEFWGQESFGYGIVVLDESVELHVPKGKYVKVWSPGHESAKKESGDEVVYRWTGSQLEPTINKDGKANLKEVDPDGELPAIAWTSFKGWEEIGTWYRGLEADRVVADADVKAKVAELTAGKTTEEDKVRALYGYVATQVRYIGVAFGVGRYQPHPAREVLRNQYGDCKDKHTLLAAMLTSAGFHPEAVLIGAGIRMNEEVPSPGAFNHLITTVPVDGKQVWLDATAEVAPYQVLLPVIRDKQALVIPETGTPMIERTPATLPFANFTKFVATGTLGKDGTMRAQMEYASRGDDELAMRALLRQVPPGQWDQMVQQLSQGLGFGGTTSHAEASRPDITDDQVKLNYDYEREKFGDWDNYKIAPLFPMVFLTTVDEKNPPKKQPIELGTPGVATAISIIKLPDGWGAELPDGIHQKTAFASFDKTYKIDHETLTVERRVEIFQKRVPAADWKAYKKWLDATVSEGETFIQLTSMGTKAEEKGPPKPGSNNTEAARLVQEAYDEIQRGEVNKAATTLGEAQKINDKQTSLWSTYGYLEYERQRWDAAVENYKKEIALNPNTFWVYNSMARAQVNGGHFDDSLATLRTLVKLNPSDGAPALTLVGMLMFSRQYEEALTVLEPLAAKSPDNTALQIQLGVAQMSAGKTSEGKVRLVAALKDTSDPNLMNTCAYELANANVELEAAEKSARKVVELLTAESANWKPGEADRAQLGKQQLLVASWDTLGWVLFREGKLDEAEGYVRASWLNQPQAEEGLHLGEIEEKKGRASAALSMYELALSSGLQQTPKGVAMKGPDKIKAELQERENALKRKGTESGIKDSQNALMKLRVLPVGRCKEKNSVAEYSIVLSGEKATELQKAPTHGIQLEDGDTRVRGAELKGWTPPGSSARLLRKGMLNCHSGECEFVVYPM